MIVYQTNTKSATFTKDTQSAGEDETYETKVSSRTFNYTFNGMEPVPDFEVKHAFTYTDRDVFTTCVYTGSGFSTCVEAFNKGLVFTKSNSATGGISYGGTPAGQDIQHNIGQSGGATPKDVEIGLYCRAKARVEVATTGSGTATVTNASTTTTNITLED